MTRLPDYETVIASLEASEYLPKHVVSSLTKHLEDVLCRQAHGNRSQWWMAVMSLPDILPSSVDFSTATIRIGVETDCSSPTRSSIKTTLRKLSPWRKGPFDYFGVHIDTEWRSDWKWQRLKPHISSLENRRVLDIGCGSGYHLWRMRGAGAQYVLGIDSSLLFWMQFMTIKRYAPNEPVIHLPLSLEMLPQDLSLFDTVFSMGMLYHRRKPLVHLRELLGFLRPGGELVLETLVAKDRHADVLIPTGRYAKMRNVWTIPSCQTAATWLLEAGFVDIKVVDITMTSLSEQRRTEWMTFESLADFLDPSSNERTIEGYPAPCRATIVARRP